METKRVATDKARKIIKENIFMTLSTCSKRGKPWATPINYVVDSKYNFYFISSKNSLHVKNITVNPDVAFTIFDSRARGDNVDGIQVEAKAQVMTGLGVLSAIKSIFSLERQKQRKPEEFLGNAEKRIVRIVPVNAYKYDRTSKIEEDRRQKVSLKRG